MSRADESLDRQGGLRTLWAETLKIIEGLNQPLFVVCSEIRLRDMSFDGGMLTVNCEELAYNLLKNDVGVLTGALNTVISPVELTLKNQKDTKIDKDEELIKLKELLGDKLEILPPR